MGRLKKIEEMTIQLQEKEKADRVSEMEYRSALRSHEAILEVDGVYIKVFGLCGSAAPGDRMLTIRMNGKERTVSVSDLLRPRYFDYSRRRR